MYKHLRTTTNFLDHSLIVVLFIHVSKYDHIRIITLNKNQKGKLTIYLNT